MINKGVVEFVKKVINTVRGSFTVFGGPLSVKNSDGSTTRFSVDENGNVSTQGTLKSGYDGVHGKLALQQVSGTTPSISGQTLIYGSLSGLSIIKDNNNNIATFAHNNTSERTYLLPDSNGTFPVIVGEYNSGTEYVVGSLVRYYGVTFQCIQTGTGKTPHMEPEYWFPVGSYENGKWHRHNSTGTPVQYNAGSSLSNETASTHWDTFSSSLTGQTALRWNISGDPLFSPGSTGRRSINWATPGIFDFCVFPHASGGSTANFDYWVSLGKIQTVGLSANQSSSLDAVGDLLRPGVQVKFSHAPGGVLSITFGTHNGHVANLTTTSGSNTATVSSAGTIAIGQLVTCTGVPVGTTVSNIVGTTVTLSANATSSATNVASFGIVTTTSASNSSFGTTPQKYRFAWDGAGNFVLIQNNVKIASLTGPSTLLGNASGAVSCASFELNCKAAVQCRAPHDGQSYAMLAY